MVTDLNTPGTLYAGAPGGVFKSIDDGGTWVSTGLPGPATVCATAAPVTVYAVSGDLTLSTLFVSRNGGATWSAALQSAFNGFGLVVDPFVTSTLYTIRNTITPRPLSGQGSLLRSTDGGATWVPFEVGSGPDSPLLTALVADRAAAGRLYAATFPFPYSAQTVYGLFRSVDSGSTWSLLTGSLGNVSALAVDPVTPSILYAGVQPSLPAAGVFKSVDGGVTFLPMNEGLTTTRIADLRIDPVHPSRVYAATDQGVFVTSDGGAHWRPMNAGLTNLAVTALAIDATGKHLHAATSSGVFDYEVAPDPAVLTLNPGRAFNVSLTATDQRTGRTGPGLAIPVNDLFGWFSIPALTANPENPEVFVKMLDGTAIDGFYWFFYGGLTDLGYTLTVTDEATGQTRTYTNPAGSECGGSDTAAFSP